MTFQFGNLGMSYGDNDIVSSSRVQEELKPSGSLGNDPRVPSQADIQGLNKPMDEGSVPGHFYPYQMMEMGVDGMRPPVRSRDSLRRVTNL
jgi:hypothetical protein